jgi:hypothetical protein
MPYDPYEFLGEGDRLQVTVAGVSFEGRQAILAVLADDQAKGDQLAGALVREPANPYDPNAIQVRIGGRQVGYVPKALAANLAPRMDRGETAQITSLRIVQGGDAGRVTFGARLDVEIQLKEAE